MNIDVENFVYTKNFHSRFLQIHFIIVSNLLIGFSALLENMLCFLQSLPLVKLKIWQNSQFFKAELTFRVKNHLCFDKKLTFVFNIQCKNSKVKLDKTKIH